MNCLCTIFDHWAFLFQNLVTLWREAISKDENVVVLWTIDTLSRSNSSKSRTLISYNQSIHPLPRYENRWSIWGHIRQVLITEVFYRNATGLHKIHFYLYQLTPCKFSLVPAKMEKLDYWSPINFLLPTQNTLTYSCLTDTKLHVHVVNCEKCTLLNDPAFAVTRYMLPLGMRHQFSKGVAY